MGPLYKVIGEHVSVPVRPCLGEILAAYLIAAMALFLPCGLAESGRISCFVLGKVSPSLCPLTGYFQEDPLFVYALEPIPSGLSDTERQKYDRQYYPRSRQILLDTYDMLFFSDARIQHFTGRQYHDLDYVFREEGMPSLWSFGPAYGQAIQTSILYDTLPVSDHDGHYHRPWRAEFHTDREPVFLPFVDLGMERIAGEGFAWVKPREGSTVWAEMVPLDTPFFVSWRPGGIRGGLIWVFADEFDLAWWGLATAARGANPYGIEMMTNLILYSLDRPLIADIQTRRGARHLISTFTGQKLLVLSMMEWADNFGANILPLADRLRETEELVEVVVDLYLEQDYSEAIAGMQLAQSMIGEITAEAVRLKDQALFWVYVIEWLAVTSASMVAAFALWTLMVRRGLYRSVGTTRMRQSY